MPSQLGEWEVDAKRRRLERMADVIRRDSSLDWAAFAERFGLAPEEWEAVRQALRRHGVRPPPAAGGWWA